MRQLLPVALLQVPLSVGVLLGLTEHFVVGRGGPTQTAVLLTVVGVPLLVTQYYGVHILQGLGDIRSFNAFRVANPALFTAGVAMLAVLHMTVLACTVIWLAARMVVTVAIVSTLFARTTDGIVAVAYPHVAAHDALRGAVAARRYVLGATVACGGMAAALALVSPYLVPLLFGNRFEPSVSLTAILVIGGGG